MLRQPTFKWWECNLVWSARAHLLSLNTHLSRCVLLVVAIKYNFHTNHEQFEPNWSWPCCLLQLSGWHFLRPTPCLTQPQRPCVTVTHPHPMPPWKPSWQTTNISRSHCALCHLPLPSISAAKTNHPYRYFFCLFGSYNPKEQFQRSLPFL